MHCLYQGENALVPLPFQNKAYRPGNVINTKLMFELELPKDFVVNARVEEVVAKIIECLKGSVYFFLTQNTMSTDLHQTYTV